MRDTEQVVEKGTRLYNHRLMEYGIVQWVHQVYPYKGLVTVFAGDGADLWSLDECEVQPA